MKPYFHFLLYIENYLQPILSLVFLLVFESAFGLFLSLFCVPTYLVRGGRGTFQP